MKNFFALILLVFVIGLTIVIGSRLPVSALTVIIGVGCGVLASIPTSLLIVAVTGRRDNRYEQERNQRAYPPVVVVNSPPANMTGGPNWSGYGLPWNMAQPPAPRQFHIIGQDNDMIEDSHYNNF